MAAVGPLLLATHPNSGSFYDELVGLPILVDGEARLLYYLKSATHAASFVCRKNTQTCLIEPVIEGPEGVTFKPGTASISYYVGRYDLLVLTQGEKGGKEGMDAYVRDTCFPVVKGHESGQRWEADGDFEVTTLVLLTCFFRYSDQPVFRSSLVA